MEKLDQLNRRLAAIQDELSSLPDDDFARKHALMRERDFLRAEAAAYRDDLTSTRPSTDIIKEIRALRKKVAGAQSGYANAVGLAGGFDGTGGAAASSIGLNSGIDEGQGIEQTLRRIAALESILADRGHL